MKRVVTAIVVLLALGAAVFGYRAYLVHELRKPVLALLNDPDSAQFRAESYIGGWTVASGHLCGQVNSKNRMGGYVGYSWFNSSLRGADVEGPELKELFDKDGFDRCDLGEKDTFPWWWLRI